MKWIIDNPNRFLKERAEIEQLENDSDWLTTSWRLNSSGLLVVEISMSTHNKTFAGRMTYPDIFPNSPPYIHPQDTSERWSEHQYGEGGSLCLEWRADNWQTSITGADMIRSAYKLLSTEQHPETSTAVPSAHQLTPGQSMNNAWQRFVATEQLLSALNNLPIQSRTTIKIATLLHDSASVTYVTKITNSDGDERGIPDLPEGVSSSFPLFSIPRDGLIFKSEAFTDTSTITKSEDLISALSKAGFETDDIFIQDGERYKAKLIVLLGTETKSLKVFLTKMEKEPSFSICRLILPEPKMSRLPVEFEQLSSVRVGIVGLGSVGSKIAASIARSGISNFLLIDDDYLIPENLVRHELTWTHAGVHKVDAVCDFLKLIGPSIKVETRKTRLAGQVSALTSAATLRDLSNCDLLIDATANPEVFLLMATVAEKYNKSMVWGEVFAGGYGGLIARARPERDPNPMSVRDAIHAHLTTLPPAPYQNSQGYDVDTETPLFAFDSDVGIISTALTRMIIDTALGRDPSQFPNSVYLIGMRKEWIFEAPFDTRPIEVLGAGWNIDSESVSEEESLKALQSLLHIYEETSRVDSKPSS